MKKLVIIIVVLLILAGGGGGAYYYFFMMNEEEAMVESTEEVSPEPMAEETPEPVTQTSIEQNRDYYVISERLNVRSYPDKSSLIRSVLRKGDKVHSLEVKGEWIRISDFMVHDSGNDVADWINLEFLSETPPVITAADKRKTMVKLIKKSDDFVVHEDQFVIATQNLINDGRCTFEDFEVLGGWLISVAYKPDPVYFVYCGGIERQDKVYLNVETGEIFYPR
ncbi:SH3 domain-containing protein [Vibrio sp. HN007]|uniref:SH3 domain-containing protein n=1 Tax=Vibrio iocasae TaxID=3098914 RepID=UPI0035D526B8